MLRNIILQVIDPLYLFIPCGSVYGGLLAQFPKPEYFIGNFVMGFYVGITIIVETNKKVELFP